MSREAMKLALEALAVKFSEGWHEGIKIDASDIMLLNDAAQALAEQPAQHGPVAHCRVRPLRGYESRPKVEVEWVSHPVPGPLFTTAQPPAQRKPLTDEEWQSIADTLGCFITRGQKDAIEAALGIKKNT